MLGQWHAWERGASNLGQYSLTVDCGVKRMGTREGERGRGGADQQGVQGRMGTRASKQARWGGGADQER